MQGTGERVDKVSNWIANSWMVGFNCWKIGASYAQKIGRRVCPLINYTPHNKTKL